MWYAIITIIVLIYFLVKSKSDFFKQDRETLAEYRYQLLMMLKYKGRSEEDIVTLNEKYEKLYAELPTEKYANDFALNHLCESIKMIK